MCHHDPQELDSHETILSQIYKTKNNLAVHVELTISNLIEPSPCYDSIASWDISGDGKGVIEGYLKGWVVSEVARRASGRTAAFDRMNNLPSTILVRSDVISDRNLARTSAVDSCTKEGEGWPRAACYCIDRSAGLIDSIR